MSLPAHTIESVPQVNEDARLLAQVAPDSIAADQFRLLLGRLDRAAAVRQMRTIAITSCARGEGRSLTAANLALTAAREGRKVALVECDLKRPSLAQFFDLAPRAGLAEVAEGKAELSQALSVVGNLSVLCAGTAQDSAAVLRSPRFAAALEALRSSFGLVIIDAPPALAFSEAGRLASMVDGVVLVVRAGQTPRDVVRMAVETLSDRLVGMVLNGVEEHGYQRYLRDDAQA